MGAMTKLPPRSITFSARLAGHDFVFHSTWGLFSPKDIDEGTRLLIENLSLKPDALVLDLGCGYGPLGLACAELAPNGHVDLVDKDFVAVDYALRNIEANHLPNANAFLSNGFDQIPDGRRYDTIVSNVPAKIGAELLSLFLADAYAHLNPGGQLYVVTISGLKEYMKRNLGATFGNYEKLKQSKTYTAAVATKS
jgi:16S rRNA (guanine1207-N2)-methyltransferase